MLPHKHAIISLAVGVAGWGATGEPAACVAALGTGVLPDVDHIVDYAYYRWRGVHRLILPLHGYEFAILGTVAALLGGGSTARIAALSYWVHLLADQRENRTHIFGYSLLFRARHRFRIEDISTTPEDAVKGRMDDMRLVGNIFQR
jgi:hypothetical protein